MHEPLFEPAALARSAAGDADLRRELVQLFRVEAEKLRRRLAEAAAEDDREAAAAAAHRLRGSAGVVGGLRLRAACAELESESATAPRERWTALVVRVESVTADTLAALRAAHDPYDLC